jgi:hypothetical protein
VGKPRIVIADADETYIAPLQQKFIEAFFDKIDLEIITEEECFRSLFSAPQKMDILVVSEAFYSIELQRHNIENIFLMTEQSSDGQTSDLLVNKIFKYAKNVKEIFHEIIGSSSDSLCAKTEIKKQTQTILLQAEALEKPQLHWAWQRVWRRRINGCYTLMLNLYRIFSSF